MNKQIYVNLPVKNLDKSKAFFAALGYTFNPQFTNENGACMVVSDAIYVMLLAEPFFQTFTKKTIVDATKSTEVLVCLSVDSRAAVDDLVAKAVAAGGVASNPAQDHGFMYIRGFGDLDGHLWELAYMDPSQSPNV